MITIQQRPPKAPPRIYFYSEWIGQGGLTHREMPHPVLVTWGGCRLHGQDENLAKAHHAFLSAHKTWAQKAIKHTEKSKTLTDKLNLIFSKASKIPVRAWKQMTCPCLLFPGNAQTDISLGLWTLDLDLLLSFTSASHKSFHVHTYSLVQSFPRCTFARWKFPTFPRQRLSIYRV